MGEPLGKTDPAHCWHPRVRRLGKVRLPFPPYRVYLLSCGICANTITTETLREQGRVLLGRTRWLGDPVIEP